MSVLAATNANHHMQLALKVGGGCKTKQHCAFCHSYLRKNKTVAQGAFTGTVEGGVLLERGPGYAASTGWSLNHRANNCANERAGNLPAAEGTRSGQNLRLRGEPSVCVEKSHQRPGLLMISDHWHPEYR